MLLTVGIVAACGATAFYAHRIVRARQLRRKQEREESAFGREERKIQGTLGYPIDPGSIKLSGVNYSPLSQFLQGRAQNNSGKPLVGLTLHVTFLDSHGVLDEEDCQVGFGSYSDNYIGIPSGETQGFEVACPAIIDAPHGQHVFLRTRIISAAASTP